MKTFLNALLTVAVITNVALVSYNSPIMAAYAHTPLFTQIYQPTSVSHKLLEKYEDRMVFVELKDIGAGSAFQIAPGLYITAKHVSSATAAENMKLYTDSTHSIPVLKTISSPNHDVGLLITQEGSELVDHLDVITNINNPAIHDLIYKVGYSMGVNLTSGEQEALGTTVPDMLAIFMPDLLGGQVASGGGFHGDSGCPIFNKNSELIGILVAGGPVDVLELPKEKTKRTTPLHETQDIINRHHGNMSIYMPIAFLLELLPNLKKAS